MAYEYFVMKNVKIVFMMTVENLHGREFISKLLEWKVPILAIIIEHKSKLSENTRSYLKNDFYDPGTLEEIIKESNMKIHYVENHNDEETRKLLNFYDPDYIVLGGTRLFKEHIIETAKIGIFNAHPALLPKYQGLDCIAWSILNNDPVGATIHFIDSGVDSGPIILQEEINYTDCKNLIQVRIKVMKKAAELMVKSLLGIHFGTLIPKPQELSLGIRHESISEEKLNEVEKIILMQSK